MGSPRKFKFEAKIEAATGGGAFVLFPYDVEKAFGTKGRVPVKATFDGAAYTGVLVRYGRPQHMLPVPKAIRAGLGKSPGDTIAVVLWKDEEERILEVPEEFKRLIESEGLLPFFERLSYTHRKEYCRWITDAKKEATRAQRLEKAVRMLKEGVKTPG